MADTHAREIENYTIPFLVMAFVLLVAVSVALWAVAGYHVALMPLLAIHLALNRTANL